MKSYKKLFAALFSIIFCLIAIPVLNASATGVVEGVTDDGFKYSIIGDDVQLISYVGSSTDITIPTTVEGKLLFL